MSFIGPIGKNLPTAYNGCTCICHREEGVIHFVPCCYPKENRVEIIIQDEILEQEQKGQRILD